MTTDDLHPVVAELVSRRRASGVPIIEVARRMSTSTMTIRRIERGDVTPSIDVIDRYASAIGAALSWDTIDLADEVPDDLQVGARVTVDWGLDEGMPGTIAGIHGSPTRVWIQVELQDGPTVDVPVDAVKPRRRPPKRSAT